MVRLGNVLLIKGGRVYGPEYLGEKDIVVIGDHVIGIGMFSVDDLRGLKLDINLIDASGCYVTPGLIDQHVHIIGAGGEGGPQFRTPPIDFNSIVSSGVTSVVGLLGTDGITRSLRELLMKARQLELEGVDSWIYTGSYQVPPPTITGNVADDIMLIDKVIGVKISISDHRSSHPTISELRKLTSDARVAGILSGKAGVVHVHVGDEPPGLTPLLEVIEGTLIPIEQFTPTHLNRSEYLLEQAIEFGKKGGYVDVTTAVQPDYGFRKSIEASKAVKELVSKGVPIERVTMSSDAQGSLPIFNERGELIKTGVASISTLLKEFRKLIINEGLRIEDAVKTVSTNVAKHLRLTGRGVISKGSHADILVLDDELRVKYVIAGGRVYKQ